MVISTLQLSSVKCVQDYTGLTLPPNSVNSAALFSVTALSVCPPMSALFVPAIHIYSTRPVSLPVNVCPKVIITPIKSKEVVFRVLVLV